MDHFKSIQFHQNKPGFLQSVLLFLFVVIATVGCNGQIDHKNLSTATPSIITLTLPPTLTPHAPETPLPPSPKPTIAPVEGVTSTQLNVRAEPSTASEVLGIIAASTRVEIVGKDPAENWWQINYPNGVDGKGWVTAQYVTTAGKPVVPVVGGNTSNPNVGGNAVIIQQLNVRSGPGIDFDTLGVLNANDFVNLIGKNDTGTWFQIEFTGGPDGKGWVNAGFVKAGGTDSLPIIAESGEVVGTGTPVATALPPTPTLIPAPMDNDSADQPMKTVKFDRVGTLALIYNGSVSAPTGDAEDWIAFTPYDAVVYASIECAGSNAIMVQITGSGSSLVCNEPLKAISVQSGVTSLVHIRSVSNSGALEYTNYILTIKASP